jgi:hypothetical protein
MYKLTRREIIECLIKQGLQELSKIKAECRRYELYWEECISKEISVKHESQES